MKLSLSAVVLAVSLAGGAVAQCPDFTEYSQTPQGTPSTGPLGLPYMRPDPACRTFNSTAVENVIANMTSRIKDPDLARLFENTFPNTLDTTVKYFNAVRSLSMLNCGSWRNLTPTQTAQWLRDTANQFATYVSLIPLDPSLATLFKAVINNEARYVTQYPYCGSFQPPPESGLAPSINPSATGVTVQPPVDNQTVLSYEIDSLCGFLKLSRTYYGATNDSTFMNDNWYSAVSQIFRVIDEQSQASFDADFNWVSYYNWTGGNGALSPAVDNAGYGEPKGYTGMVGTHHRPSDDLSTFAFLTPANAMLSAKTEQGKNFTTMATTWSKRVSDSVWANTLVNDIFAYETNGLGSRYVMDDANVPVLPPSLPYLGFLDMSNPSYVATRKLLLSRGNPYYAQGAHFRGIGGPHVDAWNPWPMSQITAIFGTDDDNEILESLYLIANVLIYDTTSYTRPWFAWANSYFAEMMLDLAQRKPSLIFTNDEPYVPGQ
ncbi:Six-hairpin glycosidase-like protein [Mycena galopus ATCC 62051]|nr:Six-hairpin glycosidase-like protein [Mycena galopus ATCC 62051]